MKATFEHKYGKGDIVYIKFGPDILAMTVVGIICTREYIDDNGQDLHSDNVEYWLSGNTTTVYPEDHVFSSQEELLNNLDKNQS